MIECVSRSIENSRAGLKPFKHWLLRDVFPPDIHRALINLPMNPPESYGADGKRSSTKNRIFFNGESCARFEVCRQVVGIFQSRRLLGSLEKTLGVKLSGSYLRIGYYVDKEGFWLEPHTDLDVKLITMTVYLSKQVASENIGTDLFDAEKRTIATAPSDNNAALIFLPGDDTWHGLNKKHITGPRKILIINYVTEAWESRHELSYPAIPSFLTAR